MIRKYKGEVSTDKAKSISEFYFEIDDEDLPEDPNERRAAIDDIALEEMLESGKMRWDFGEVTEDDANE